MNKKYLLTPLLALAALTGPTAFAGFNGTISFTDAERAEHASVVNKIETTAAACLQRDLDHHRTFLRKNGFSPYYGDRGSFGKLSYAGKREYLRQLGFNPRLLEQMEPISCVELMLNCLGEGFKAAGEAGLWSRIRAFTLQNGVDGMATQYGLQKLGWKVLYWNPDVRYNREWDREEKAKNPSNSDRFWGYHEENWVSVQRRSTYLYNRVDDRRELVNFGATTPAFLKRVPFWVGIGHMGYHVFPGSFGNVVEAHSTRRITDPKSLESDAFNPLAGRAPTGGMYHTGLIAVPPGYLDVAPAPADDAPVEGPAPLGPVD